MPTALRLKIGFVIFREHFILNKNFRIQSYWSKVRSDEQFSTRNQNTTQIDRAVFSTTIVWTEFLVKTDIFGIVLYRNKPDFITNFLQIIFRIVIKILFSLTKVQSYRTKPCFVTRQCQRWLFIGKSCPKNKNPDSKDRKNRDTPTNPGIKISKLDIIIPKLFI